MLAVLAEVSTSISTGSLSNKQHAVIWAYFFLEALGKNLFSCLFPLLETTCTLWLLVYLLLLQSKKKVEYSHEITLTLNLLSPFTVKDPHGCMVPPGKSRTISIF
jgi:hypothetical protein